MCVQAFVCVGGWVSWGYGCVGGKGSEVMTGNSDLPLVLITLVRKLDVLF